MVSRRLVITALPLSAFAISADCLLRAQETAGGSAPAIASPPVVQHRTPSGFSVVFKTGTLATAWVDWGTSKEDLSHRSFPQHHGLKGASDIALSTRVEHGSDLAGSDIYYRITAVPLSIDGRTVNYGSEVVGAIHKLRKADAGDRVHIAIVNDTHENWETIGKLADRIESVDPDALIWNGDTCNDFHPGKDVAGILLKPGQRGETNEGGWASSRPLLFVPGNHDARGRLAYHLQTCLPGWPGGAGNSGIGLPYCSMHRVGPVAFVTLDTGEDKPDAHPSFQGTAAYEPYREQQAMWLQEVMKKPEFQSAPYKIAICHIPLRGLPGHPDGTVMEGFAYFSGFGARHWMKPLVDANVQAIVSGHMHQHRIDPATDGLPTQIVLGGPRLEAATLTRIVGDSSGVSILVENIAGEVLIKHELS